MNTLADLVINHLGGTSAVARLIEAPTSTVHSWRRIGIPSSRMAHLRLAAKVDGKPLPDDLNDLQHAGTDAAPQQAQSTGQSGETSGAQLRGVA